MFQILNILSILCFFILYFEKNGKERSRYKKWYLTVIAALAVFLVIVSAGSLIKKSQGKTPVQAKQTVKSTKVKPEVKKQSAIKELKRNQPMKFKNSQMTITDYALAHDYNGKPVLVISYTWENTGKETNAPFKTYLIRGFQAGVETTKPSLIEEIDIGLAHKEVQPGGKVEKAQDVIGIDDLKKPLDIELKEAFGSNDEIYKTTLDLSKLKEVKNKKEDAEKKADDKEDPGKFDKNFYMRVGPDGKAYKINNYGYTPDGQYFPQFDYRRSDANNDPPGDIGDLEHASEHIRFDQEDLDRIHSVYEESQPTYEEEDDSNYYEDPSDPYYEENTN